MGKILTVILLSMTSFVCAGVRLCGYELNDSQVNFSTPDPSASVSVVQGGIDSAPNPSEGDYILKLSWTNETDRKVEVKHYWPNQTFSLANQDKLFVDIYIPSGLDPSLIGIWDSVFGWHSIVNQISTNGWFTAEFDVSANQQSGLNSIDALLFEGLSAISGIIYIDNMRLGYPFETGNEPTLKFVQGQEKAISLSWDPIAVSGLNGYNIYRAAAGSNVFIKLNSQPISLNAYTDFVGANGSLYTYKITSIVNGVESGYSNQMAGTSVAQTDEEFLTSYQRAAFRYFWDWAHPASGLAREAYGYGHNPDTCTIGASGMGVMSIIVGSERGFVSRVDAAKRTLKILRFLKFNTPRFHGAWPHWVNGETGNVIPFSANDDGADLVETTFMAQAILTARQYYTKTDPIESEIRSLAQELWEDIDWSWFRRTGDTDGDLLYWHWSSTKGWAMNMPIRGFNEAMMAYVLGAASPTHSIPAVCYHNGWAGNNYLDGKEYYGYRITVSHFDRPLFLTQYPFHALDPRNKRDEYCDYFENARNITLSNRAYCMANPGNHLDYGVLEWGLSADWNPWGYAAHCPVSNDNGTISTYASIASMPFTPDESISMMRYIYDKYGSDIYDSFGFVDSYNRDENWFSGGYTALNPGSNIIMIENSRSQLLWDLFMSCSEINPALEKLGWSLKSDSGLKCKYYEGTWNSLPDFSTMTPIFEKTVSNFSPIPRNRDDRYGLCFTGYIDIDVAGQYSFYLNSDDGSKLYLDGSLIVNNDGTHGPIEKTGVVYLSAGLHAIRVDYFEDILGEKLEVSYSGPGIVKQKIPVTVLQHNVNPGDLNEDGNVDSKDLWELTENWLFKYDLTDFTSLAENW